MSTIENPLYRDMGSLAFLEGLGFDDIVVGAPHRTANFRLRAPPSQQGPSAESDFSRSTRNPRR